MAAAAALAIGAAGAASAATVTILAEDNAAYGMVDPTAGTALPGSVLSLDAAINAGSLNNVYRSPYDGSGFGATAVPGFEDLAYYTTGPHTDNQPSPATMLLKSQQSVFTMLWGSVDGYNSLEFLLGGVTQAIVQGADLIAMGATGGKGAALVQVTGLAFDKIVFHSEGNNALEFANISAVPLPAGGLLLLGGLGGLAALRRRKKAA